ncbi:MAG: hypothetical protein JWP02_2889, partial [Acidimicrobiales bacterium]|nr:hypothetical protein [Acidimicrobiales bacterium]
MTRAETASAPTSLVGIEVALLAGGLLVGLVSVLPVSGGHV